MKKIFLVTASLLLFLLLAGKSNGQVNNPGTVVTTDASNQANNNINNSVNNGLNGVANGVKGLFKKKKKSRTATALRLQACSFTASEARINHRCLNRLK